MLSKYENKYDAIVSSSTSPTKGTDPVTGRHTLSLDGSQYLTCPMDWNTNSGPIDNLQVFIVFKYTDVSGMNIRDCIFGHDNGGWDRLIGLFNKNTMIVGGTTVTNTDNSGCRVFSTFPKDADPRKTDKFCILSAHWNNKGSSGCGENKSSVYCK